MEFKEKVLLNARKFARRFSMAKGKNSETKQSVYEDIENNFRLVRSQSARLNSEQSAKRIRPASSFIQKDNDETSWQKALTAVQTGSATNLKRILQFNQLDSVKDQFLTNGYDKHGRTLAIHFSAKCPRKSINQMIQVLREVNVDFDLGTKSEGITPLMMAVQREDCDLMVAALLSIGADPKIVDYNGDSALHWLESSGFETDKDLFEERRTEARQDLINYGARSTTRNSRSIRPDDIRRLWNHNQEVHFDPEGISSDEGIRSTSPIQDSPESESNESDLENKLRTYGRYEELDYYMERIVEIQQQISYISKA